MCASPQRSLMGSLTYSRIANVCWWAFCAFCLGLVFFWVYA